MSKRLFAFPVLVAIAISACADPSAQDDSEEVVGGTEDALIGNPSMKFHSPKASTLEYQAIRVAVAQHTQRQSPKNALRGLAVPADDQHIRVQRAAQTNVAWAFARSTPTFANPGNGDLLTLLKYDAATFTWVYVDETACSSCEGFDETAAHWERKYGVPTTLFPNIKF